MGLREKFTKLKSNRIAVNTFMLSLLYVVQLLLGFIAQGYYSRIVDGVGFGIIQLALAARQIFQLFIDFGFMMYSIGEVSKHREDTEKIRKIVTTVTLSKLFFSGVSVIFMGVYIGFMNMGPAERMTYWLYLVSTIVMAMVPDYLYKGFEKMSAITLRTIIIKTFSTAMIFVFFKEPEDYYMLPLFEIIGNAVAVLVIYWHMKTKLNITFTKVKLKEVLASIRAASQFFVSRIASTVYGKVNVFVLEWFVDPTKTLSGAYGAANTLIDAARLGIVSPITDSVYPSVMKSRNFSVIKKALVLTFPIILVGCTVVFIFAEQICLLWLGEENGTGNVVMALRALMPVVAISLPNYMFGFPTLNPMGLVKHANMSVNIGTIIHIAALAVLALTGAISLFSICILTCCTEFFVLMYRVIIIVKNRHLMKPGALDEAKLEDEVYEHINDDE